MLQIHAFSGKWTEKIVISIVILLVYKWIIICVLFDIITGLYIIKDWSVMVGYRETGVWSLWRC
jgi:hypothetical protein